MQVQWCHGKKHLCQRRPCYDSHRWQIHWFADKASDAAKRTGVASTSAIGTDLISGTLDGYLDDFMIFARLLTADEIFYLFNSYRDVMPDTVQNFTGRSHV